ncbi:MAG: DUF6778 family protein [Paracoccaceae bacterium]
MNAMKTLAAFGLALALGACGSVEPASRNVQPDGFGLSVASKNGPTTVALAPQYDVAQIRILVPTSLKVSEANRFYPLADVVWRGEPRGDRYAQVKAIFEDGFSQGTVAMHTGPKVVVEAEVLRFHCLTEKTRYTVGGMHSVKFNLTVRDAVTGVVIDGPRLVNADIKASGGALAIAEDQAGRTQRVVIVEHLAEVIRKELSRQRYAPELNGAPTSRLESGLILSPVALVN